MRNFGAILLLLGVLGFLYASTRLSDLDPYPANATLRQSLDYPAGRWELARYGAAGAALIGLLLALYPKGR